MKYTRIHPIILFSISYGVLIAVLVFLFGGFGCTSDGKLDLSQVFPAPSTQPLTAQEALDAAQRDLTAIYLATDIVAVAKGDEAAEAKIDSYYAAAQAKINLLAAVIKDVKTPPNDLIALETQVLQAIKDYQKAVGK